MYQHDRRWLHKSVSLILPVEQNYFAFFSNSCFPFKIKSKFDLLNSHIRNSEVIKKKCQTSEELWHLQHPKDSSVPCPEHRWSRGDACPAGLLTIPVPEETCCSCCSLCESALLTYALQRLPKDTASCWWHYERTTEEKVGFSETASQRPGQAVRGGNVKTVTSSGE